MNSVLTKSQKKSFTRTADNMDMVANVRYDDQCENGHNSFAITLDAYESGKPHTDRYYIMGGCCHDAVKKHFPELAHLIKWHLTSSDGPMYYVENTIYHAGDTDHNGLLCGEHSAYTKTIHVDAIENGTCEIYSTDTMYANNKDNPNLEKVNVREQKALDAFLSIVKTDLNPTVNIEQCEWSISEGKPHDLEAARSCAVWPDATIEQLRDKSALMARLPALMDSFKFDVEALGFIF